MVAVTNDPLVCVEFSAVIECQLTDTLYRVTQKATMHHVKQSECEMNFKVSLAFVFSYS